MRKSGIYIFIYIYRYLYIIIKNEKIGLFGGRGHNLGCNPVIL